MCDNEKISVANVYDLGKSIEDLTEAIQSFNTMMRSINEVKVRKSNLTEQTL